MFKAYHSGAAKNTKYIQNFNNKHTYFKRDLSIKKSQFISQNGCKVIDYVFTHSKGDTKESIYKELNSFLSQPDTLFILTQPSRFLLKEKGISRPLAIKSAEELLELKKAEKKLVPDPGHICGAATNKESVIQSDLSFRPDLNAPAIVEVTVRLHPKIYGNFSNQIRKPLFKNFLAEIVEAARVLYVDHTSTIHLSILTGFNISHKLPRVIDAFEVIKNKNSELHMNIYNLCSSFIQENDLSNLQDPAVLKTLQHLIQIAESLPYPAEITSAGKRRIAALACGHAMAKAFFQDAHKLERTKGLDLATQQYAAFIIADLIQDEKYLETTPLLDDTANTLADVFLQSATKQETPKYRPK